MLHLLHRLADRGDLTLAVGVIWLVMLLVQNASPKIIGIDGYYHIKMAWLMREGGIKLDFPWLPLTLLNPHDFTNHHLLYHLLLLPFAYVPDLVQASESLSGLRFADSFHDALRLGGKLAGLVYSVVGLMAVYLVLARLRVRYQMFWLAVLLASGEWFLARLAMTRRQSVALALLLLAVYLLVSRRYRWLAPVAFAYAWLFDGFVLLMVVAGLSFVARLLAERKLDWPVLGWTALGLWLAVLLHPYFPNNVVFTYHHVVQKLVMDGEVRVGSEWYPYSREVLLRTSWLALMLVPLGLIPSILAGHRALKDSSLLFLGGLALLFLVLYLRSRRFIESEPAFAVLFCAYTWTHYTPRFRGRAVWSLLPLGARLALISAVLAGLVVQANHVVNRAVRNVAEGDNRFVADFEVAALWLAQHATPGEPLFQTDWDDFPELFFYNHGNSYIVGLDPTYMYLEHPELYRLWRSIGRGEVAQPGRLIREQFGARWVITDRRHEAFMEQAGHDTQLLVAFESPTAVVYRVADGDPSS